MFVHSRWLVFLLNSPMLSSYFSSLYSVMYHLWSHSFNFSHSKWLYKCPVKPPRKMASRIAFHINFNRNSIQNAIWLCKMSSQRYRPGKYNLSVQFKLSSQYCFWAWEAFALEAWYLLSKMQLECAKCFVARDIVVNRSVFSIYLPAKWLIELDICRLETHWCVQTTKICVLFLNIVAYNCVICALFVCILLVGVWSPFLFTLGGNSVRCISISPWNKLCIIQYECAIHHDMLVLFL